MAKNINLETEGVLLLEALKLVTEGCAGIQRLRDTHSPTVVTDGFVRILDLLLWGATPMQSFLETDPAILDPLIELVESGEYLVRLKQLRDRFAKLDEVECRPTPESVRAAEIYQKRRWGSMN